MKDPYKIEAKKYRVYFIIFAILTCLIPFISYFEFCKPANEKFPIWFQRSGSVMVLFGLISEYFAIQMLNVFRTIKIQGEPKYQVVVKYASQARKFESLAFLLILIGTIIWGYGDIIVKSA